MNDWTADEIACVAASHEIVDGETVFVGVGKPVIAAFLAKLTHAPHITIVFETGIVRSGPCELPMLLDTLSTQDGADLLNTAGYVTALAARGRVDLGLIGAGQVDQHGNVNSVAAGPYDAPVVRWPGGGGANDIGSLCRRTVVLLDQNARRLPPRVDFVTSPGHDPKTPRDAHGPQGPSVIITDLATFAFEEGLAALRSRHPGVDASTVTAATGWPIDPAKAVEETPRPTREELDLLRTVIDPSGLVLRPMAR